jgi:hypothetical protein
LAGTLLLNELSGEASGLEAAGVGVALRNLDGFREVKSSKKS